MTGKNNILIFPEFEELVKEIEKLRTELSMLILERDNLTLVECKNIEMEYILSLGYLENKTIELHYDVLRLQRKISLVQRSINRQEKINIKNIDKILDEEFLEFQKKINEETKKVNDAINRIGLNTLSEEEAKELKTLYRKIAKAYHPDLNPDLSEEKKQIFFQGVKSYERGDLESLRILEVMVEEKIITKSDGDSLKDLRDETKRLKKVIDYVNKDIEKIKISYPYNMKIILDNEELMRENKTELEEQVEELKKIKEVYKHALGELQG